MTKIWCAELECKHCKNNRCIKKEINLSAGYKHTVHDGLAHVWNCNSFEEDEDTKYFREKIKEMFGIGDKK